MHRVVLARDSFGTPVDIALGAMPFETRSVLRASEFLVGEKKTIRTCSAEDLVVHKVFAGRPQDWVDVASILMRTHQLDWIQIEEELLPLLELKEEPEACLTISLTQSNCTVLPRSMQNKRMRPIPDRAVG